MPKHRKNRGGTATDGLNAKWFDKNVKRQRNRNKMAKLSKRKNRPKK